MSNVNITKEEIDAILPKVADIIADALGCDLDDVQPTSSLITDLGGESIDFLDIVFRLEREFKVKIPRGKIVEDARGPLAESEFEKGGVVTAQGEERLREFLSEVPADRFKSPIKSAEIPKLFTVETFAKMIIREQRASSGA
ncbi:MAG: Acyl carrier protein [Verrucomicrobia bacterium]|jgi:acyl carrier protein|nr:MAG: Acyl carrier protein [Verrucomicrobiota bacterium]